MKLTLLRKMTERSLTATSGLENGFAMFARAIVAHQTSDAASRYSKTSRAPRHGDWHTGVTTHRHQCSEIRKWPESKRHLQINKATYLLR